MAQRFLLKLRKTGERSRLHGLQAASGDTPFKLRFLFEGEKSAVATAGFAAAGSSEWYLAEAPGKKTTDAPLASMAGMNPWDVAHRLLREGVAGVASTDIEAIEPDLQQHWNWKPPEARAPFGVAPTLVCAPGPIDQSLPPFRELSLDWHLMPDRTGLKAAREEVGKTDARKIVIVHLDTGYDPNHATMPRGLARDDRQRNFVDRDKPNDATDPAHSGLLANPGHGTGTLSILAGAGGKDLQGDLGGAPDATVVPVRIADSVVHFWTSTVAEGINYAREIKADVVSMSMGGLPSQAWADAVNAAYEAGIVIVCAAGNNFSGLPTPYIVYPARFHRVIAACGVMANGRPYFDLPLGKMQGNYGPASKMATAMVAFTPNIGWAHMGCGAIIDHNGAGTSSATPQIAAAAALWLAKYRDELADYPGWARVEAVQSALFESARTASDDTHTVGEALAYSSGDTEDTHHLANLSAFFAGEIPKAKAATASPPKAVHDFFGQGILDAAALLEQRPKKVDQLVAKPVDDVNFAFLKMATGLGIAGDNPHLRLYRLELAQLAADSKWFADKLSDPDIEAMPGSGSDVQDFVETVLDSGKASAELRVYLESLSGRAPAIVSGGCPPPPAGGPLVEGRSPPGDPPPGASARSGTDQTSAELNSRIARRPPKHRRLRIFALDPGFSNRLDTAALNRTVLQVRWESKGSRFDILEPGPVGEYIEVVDIDPATACAYAPVDLNDPLLMAEDGIAPDAGDPKFHQQMVYAVAMKTIDYFEGALGRSSLWTDRRYDPKRDSTPGPRHHDLSAPEIRALDRFVRRLRIYPHALRGANAYYSPDKVALLFGYFPEARTTPKGTVSGSIVFTCLSHDVIAHETTHALLDGLHRRYKDASNPDVLAFHEAFADIVAIFQHFTFPELLRYAVAKARGNLRQSNVMADLAREFGESTGRSKALRSALGNPDSRPEDYAATEEPHERGAILVAAVFDAFLSIYDRRVEDLLRIATGGSGLIGPGALHPDLVARLAEEANKAAQHTLRLCIRALDYCPPFDITFGDYLRAVITADSDLVPEDDYGYRTAFLQAFKARGIHSEDIRTLSVESLRWRAPDFQPPHFIDAFKEMDLEWNARSDRLEAWKAARSNAVKLHDWIAANLGAEAGRSLGLDLSPDAATGKARSFEVHSVRPARRIAPDGTRLNEVVVVLTQQREEQLDAKSTFKFRGGCTLIVDPKNAAAPIRYCVMRRILSSTRLAREREFRKAQQERGLYGLYFGDAGNDEPFCFLHGAH